MVKYLLMLLLVLALTSCGNDANEVEEIESPFLQFLGDWELESRTSNGFPEIPTPVEHMTIEEDGDASDAIAIGSYEEGTPIVRYDISLELPGAENRIKLYKRGVIFNCNYVFQDTDQFDLIDFFDTDSITIVSRWKRK